jgi:hypothetical protein
MRIAALLVMVAGMLGMAPAEVVRSQTAGEVAGQAVSQPAAGGRAPEGTASPEAICPGGSSPDPAVVFCEDYERGVLATWPGYTGAWRVTTEAPYAGRYALDIRYGALPAPGDGSGGGGYGVMPDMPALDEFRMRWYEKFSEGWRWSPIATKGWQLRPADGRWDIYLLNDVWGEGERITALQETRYRGYTELGQNERRFRWDRSLGEWHLVEVHIALNTPGRKDGVFEQWVNGTLTSRHTRVQYRDDTQGVDTFMLSAYWNCADSDCRRHRRAEQHRYLDNIVVARGGGEIGEAR